MSNSITKVAVIGTGVIGAGWIIRALAHNKKVTAYDKDIKLKKKLVVEIKRTWPYVKKLFNKKKLNLKNFKYLTSIKEALKEAFKHKGFILLTFGFFVCGFNITLVSAHIPGYIQERGFEAWTAFAILSLIGLFNIFGTLTFGYLSGKYSKKILLSLNYFGRGLAIIFFMFMPASPLVAIIFGVVFGFLWLSTVPPTLSLIHI